MLDNVSQHRRRHQSVYIDSTALAVPLFNEVPHWGQRCVWQPCRCYVSQLPYLLFLHPRYCTMDSCTHPVASLLITGGRFPQIWDLFHGLRIRHSRLGQLQFSTRDALDKGGLCCRKMSVCPFVTRRYCVVTAKHIIKLFSPWGSDTILVFFVPNVIAIFRWRPPNGGAESRGMKNCDFWPVFRVDLEMIGYMTWSLLLWNANRNSYAIIIIIIIFICSDKNAWCKQRAHDKTWTGQQGGKNHTYCCPLWRLCRR